MFQSTLEDIKDRVSKLKDKVTLEPTFEQILENDIRTDAFPSSDSPNKCCNEIYYSVKLLAPTNTAYTDLTGRFPYRSSRGNQYIIVAYSYDANAILAIPINNRSAAFVTKAWEHIYNRLHITGVKAESWILDMEASNLLKDTMVKDNTTYQLVPSHIHGANTTERAIKILIIISSPT